MNRPIMLCRSVISKGFLLFAMALLFALLIVLPSGTSHAVPRRAHDTSNLNLVLMITSFSSAPESVELMYQLPNNGGVMPVCQVVTPNQWSPTFPPPSEAPVLLGIDLYPGASSCGSITNQSPVMIVAIPTTSNPPVNTCWFNFTNGILSGCVVPSQTLTIQRVPHP